MNYTWGDKGGRVGLYADRRCIGHLRPFAREAIHSTDRIERVDDGVFKWTRRFTPTRALAAPEFRLTMDFVAEHEATWFMIAAVSYNGNHWGSGREPKGLARDGVPWSFADHRTAVRGGTYSEGCDWAVALFAPPQADGLGCACSLVPGSGCTVHRLIWPEEERPAVYHQRDQYTVPFYGALSLKAGEMFTATAYLVVTPVEEPRTAYRKLLDVAWRMNYRPPRMRFTPESLWRLGVQFAKRELWAEEGPFRGFSVGLLWDGARWHQRDYYKYEIGWAGQNASLANSMLHDFLRTGDESSLAIGIGTLDCWSQHARLESGLLRCVFDPLLGDCRRPELQDACNLGSAAEAFFEAYELAERCGLDKPAYRDTALGICGFVIRHQHEDGRVGRAWSNDGVCVAEDGATACYFIPALVAAYRASGAREYLAAAEKAFRFYIGGLAAEGYTTAGALDTHCIDRESAAPLLTSGLALYDLTGDESYLRGAERAAYYLATWQWHHTVPCPPQSALVAIDYDSFGGTGVSTQHHHIDPWAVRYAGELLRLAQLTHNGIWRQRALAGWANGMLGVSNGNLVLEGAPVPAGGQPEAFFHTRWGNRGGVSMWLVAWPTAFRLETLRRLQDWSALEG